MFPALSPALGRVTILVWQASRTAWRIALAALWYGNATADGARAADLTSRLANGLAAQWDLAHGGTTLVVRHDPPNRRPFASRVLRSETVFGSLCGGTCVIWSRTSRLPRTAT